MTSSTTTNVNPTSTATATVNASNIIVNTTVPFNNGTSSPNNNLAQNKPSIIVPTNLLAPSTMTANKNINPNLFSNIPNTSLPIATTTINQNVTNPTSQNQIPTTQSNNNNTSVATTLVTTNPIPNLKYDFSGDKSLWGPFNIDLKQGQINNMVTKKIGKSQGKGIVDDSNNLQVTVPPLGPKFL